MILWWGEKREDYTFQPQLNEKPSTILGCPGTYSGKCLPASSHQPLTNYDCICLHALQHLYGSVVIVYISQLVIKQGDLAYMLSSATALSAFLSVNIANQAVQRQSKKPTQFPVTLQNLLKEAYIVNKSQ